MIARQVNNKINNIQKLFHAADEALYRAKQEGRNQVSVSDANRQKS